MKKFIFLILTILIISIKSQMFDDEEIRIDCEKGSQGKYHCVFYTRNSCCYVSEWCHMDTHIHRCEVWEESAIRKMTLEYILDNERKEYEENEEYEEY